MAHPPSPVQDPTQFRYGAFELSDRTGPCTDATAFAYPDLAPFDGGRRRASVVVLGGGIAGLVAARELAQRGHHVTILEREDRLGGRIRTHRYQDGTYGELGAMRIPYAHRCVRHYVEDLGLTHRRFVSENPNAYLLFRGAGPVRRHQWRTVAARYPGLPPRYTLPAQQVLGMIAQHAVNELGLLAELPQSWEVLSNRIRDDDLARWEGQGVPALLRAFFCDPNNPERLDRDDADQLWTYVGRGSGQEWVEQMSVPFWLVQSGLFDLAEDGAKFEIVGGTSALVDALAGEHESLRVRVELGASVEAVSVTAAGARARWRTAEGPQVRDFDYAVCTLPAGPTADLAFDPPLPPGKTEALTALSYYPVSKTLLHCRERFWETQDGIFGGCSNTDLDHQQIWYPSDNARLVEGLTGDEYVAADEDVSSGPGVLIGAYMWGENAKRFGSKTDGERTASVIDGVRRVHPDIEKYLVDEPVHMPWATQRSPGGGGFALFGPGQHRYQEALVQPVLSGGRPRVLFAGEHLGVLQGWLQGAVQTALTAVSHVMRDNAAG